jgi:hypothetical protein
MPAERVHIIDELSIGDQYIPSAPGQDDATNMELLADLYPNNVKVDLPRVSVLIGEDVPMAHLVIETRYGPNPDHQPYGVRTPFGWCVAGPISTGKTQREATMSTQIDDNLLGERVERWWEEERHGFGNDDSRTLSVDDKRAMKILEDTTVLQDGHYRIGMFWRNSCPRVPNNIAQAIQRLNQLRRKFDLDPQFASMYTTAMQSLIDNGYMRRISHDKETTIGPIT